MYIEITQDIALKDFVLSNVKIEIEADSISDWHVTDIFSDTGCEIEDSFWSDLYVRNQKNELITLDAAIKEAINQDQHILETIAEEMSEDAQATLRTFRGE